MTSAERPEPQRVGIVIVDHGSRRRESNEMLLRLVAEFRRHSEYAIVEAAHMELAEPSIATAFQRCAEQGADRVIIYPYFLLPGRHWDQDIPALCADAARLYPGLRYLVTAPIGMHPLMLQVIKDRISRCWAHASGQSDGCDVCQGTAGCQFEGGSPEQ